jgi:lysozyme family protein
VATNNFEPCLDVVLAEEGGFVDNPEDPGKATNLGVTQAVWQQWVGASRVVTVADIRALTRADVTPLYQQVFWRGTHAELMAAGVDLAAFDWAVNSGVGGAMRAVQDALGIPSDGLVGPVTLQALAAKPPEDVVNLICNARLAFLEKDPDWAEFGRGWTDRIATIRAHAIAMAAAA